MICDFVYYLIATYESKFPILLCDLHIVEILHNILVNYFLLDKKIYVIVAHLIPYNDIYHQQIFSLFFPSALRILNSQNGDLSEIQNIFFFFYSLAHYYDFENDELLLFINLLLDFLEIDDFLSLRYILWSLRCISQSYTSELLGFENQKITYQLLTLIDRILSLTTIEKEDNANADNYSNTIFLSLSVFHILLQKEVPVTELPLFDITRLILQILSDNINQTLNIESLIILSQIIQNKPEPLTQFLVDNNIISLLNTFMVESSIGIKHQSLILFMNILQQCSNETANIILNDPNIEQFFSFVFDSEGKFFKTFAKSLAIALDKTNSIGCHMMLNENVPQDIQNLLDTINDTETEEIGQSLISLLLQDTSNLYE